MSHVSLDRRRFLQGLSLGLGAAAYLAPRGRFGSLVHAGTTPIPKRFLIYYGVGNIRGAWEPVAAPGTSAPTETSFAMSPLMASLAPHKNHLLFLKGLGMVSEEIDTGPSNDAHSQGAKHALSATDTVTATAPGGPSIDQVIARAINSPSPVTALPSLELQVSASSPPGDYSGSIATAAGAQVRSIWDPREAFRRAFPSTTTTTDTAAIEAARRAAAQRAAVSTFVQGEFGALNSRLGTADRMKLDAHLSAVRDLQARMQLAPVTTCSPPSATSFGSAITGCDFECISSNPDAQTRRDWELGMQLQTRLAVAALACDVTRVASIVVGPAQDSMFGYTDGYLGSSDSHNLWHDVANPAKPASRDANAVAMQKRALQYEIDGFASLLAQLKAIPESDGQTLLDHTVVLYCGQIGYADHTLDDLPWILAGSCGGYFRTGRYVRLPANPASRMGQPHNDLFVSIANAMGVPITRFGNPRCSNGPIAALRA